MSSERLLGATIRMAIALRVSDIVEDDFQKALGFPMSRSSVVFRRILVLLGSAAVGSLATISMTMVFIIVNMLLHLKL